MNKGANIISNFRKKWKAVILLEGLLLAGALSLSAWFFRFPTLLVILLGCLALSIYLLGRQYFKIKDEKVIDYFNTQEPKFEHAAALLQSEEGQLPPLQAYKKQALTAQFSKSNLLPKIPHHLFSTILGAGMILAIPFLFQQFEHSVFEQESQVIFKEELPIDTLESPSLKPKELSIGRVTLEIIPPSYSRQAPSKTSLGKEYSFLVGSELKWQVQIPAKGEVFLVIAPNEKHPMLPKGNGQFTYSFLGKTSFFYKIEWLLKDGRTKSTDFNKLIAIDDKPPLIKCTGIEPYQKLPFDSTLSFLADLQLDDDFGLRDLKMVATVSSGEGENVRFRDKDFPIGLPSRTTSHSLKKTIKIQDFNMKPGDELYFSFEVKDNREPLAQYARTPRFLIAFEDTTEVMSTTDFGLPVDKMPAYFRSQRQIIIDTEKLISQQGKMPQDSFLMKSNTIAIDQKILRLRYGTFLGEEFEEHIGLVIPTAVDSAHVHDKYCAHPEDTAKKKKYFGMFFKKVKKELAEAESQKDSIKTAKPKIGHNHDHGTAPTEDGDVVANLLEAYMHIHDRGEQANFFDEATTAKLRAALAHMWDAELHLRLGDPSTALPYEYKALKLIKEIQHASRIYAERVGFDPPLIKEYELRLSGDDLDKIKEKDLTFLGEKENEFEAIKAALKMIEAFWVQPQALRPNQKVILGNAGNEYSNLLLQQPGLSFKTLDYIKEVQEGKTNIEWTYFLLKAIEKAFLEAIPSPKAQAIKKKETKDELTRLFYKKLGVK